MTAASPSSGSGKWLTLGLVGLTLASLAVVCLPAIPLGVPGEWTWARRAILEIDPVSLILASLLGAGYWWTAQLMLKRTESASRSNWWSPLGPTLLGLVWLGGMLLAFPEFHGIGRAPTILYYKRTEGYFWQAAFDVRDSRSFLAGYRDSISEGDDPDRYLHLGTHPPGLTLAYRGLLRWMEQSPRLAQAVVATEPPAIRETFETLRSFPPPNGASWSPAAEATLWAATLLTLLAAATAAWPIHRLTERMSDRKAACRAALFWPLVPSLLVFFPKSDLLLPVIATTSCWLWLDGWSRRSWGRCLLAGLGFFGGLMLTLALAPIALLLALQTCFERWSRREEFRERTVAADITAVAMAVAGLVLPLVALSLWGNCNVTAIWIENLKNHAMFYDHNSRSFGLWLGVNPLEAALALGAPLACLMVVGLLRCLRQRTVAPITFSQSAAWLMVWAILWLSGKNMGEAARLWIFLAPWPVITAATVESDRRSQRVALGLQLVACLVTVAIIDGFHFAELIAESK